MSDKATQSMAERGTILKCLSGSESYGTALSSSDQDEVGVCVEDFATFVNLGGDFEQFEFRTATERTGKKDAPSQPGDLDLKIYGLKKYLRLVTYGNPNTVELLFITDRCRLLCSPYGQQLQDLAPSIISRQVGKRYLGYLTAQKQRLLGERGQMRVSRTDLIESHGFDTKYGGHVIRLGLQGVELLETGRLSMPMEENARDQVRAIRAGKWSFNEILQAAGDLEQKIKDLTKDGPLNEFPDLEVVEAWMREVYWATWSGEKFALPEGFRVH